MQESKTINAAIKGGHGCNEIHAWKNVWQKATARVAARSVSCLWTSEIKMDRLRKLQDAISRENEEDISNLEEYFTKLLKVKQNQRQLDESALLDKILNMRKDEAALSLIPEDQYSTS